MPVGAARAAFSAKSIVAAATDRRVEARFRDNEQLDPELLHVLQREQAMSIAHFAFETTPFYRRRYTDAGFTARDFSDSHFFDELPIITKAELREFRAEFLSETTSRGRRIPSSTGGSTGQPLTLFHDRRSPVAAMWWRAYRWWGISPADNRAFIQRERRSAATILKERLEWWPTKVLTLDATTMSNSTMRAFSIQWNHYRPQLLNGYVGGVHELASFVAAHGIRLTPPRAIAVTAAPITASQRQYIQQTLGAPVFDSYRSAEVPWMAVECAGHSGLHVLADARVIEVLDDSGRTARLGREGAVVVTDLCNRVFPIIRYSIGDRASEISGPCPCGRTLPRISAVQGRVTDVIRLPGGRVIPGGLTGLFNDRPDAVSQFQIHQRSDFSIALVAVPGVASDAGEVISRAAAKLRRLVADTVPVEVELVASIAHDRGKSRVVKSDFTEDLLAEVPR